MDESRRQADPSRSHLASQDQPQQSHIPSSGQQAPRSRLSDFPPKQPSEPGLVSAEALARTAAADGHVEGENLQLVPASRPQLRALLNPDRRSSRSSPDLIAARPSIVDVRGGGTAISTSKLEVITAGRMTSTASRSGQSPALESQRKTVGGQVPSTLDDKTQRPKPSWLTETSSGTGCRSGPHRNTPGVRGFSTGS